MNLIVGLTGGVGSGKTTVANEFAALGAAIVDTDVIAHQLTGVQGAAIPAIVAEFGESFLRSDGALDRPAMRKLVFSDAKAKRRLEAILHPLIRRESELQCQRAVDAPYIVLVVPLLVESDAYCQLIDRVLVVDCDETIQLARVMKRSGLFAEEARSIMAAQASRAARLADADDVIVNDTGREELSRGVADLHRQYLALAAAKRQMSIPRVNC